MSDEFREVTRLGWGKRLSQSLGGIVVGFVFFLGAFPLIWWNEGRSVDRIETLDQGRGSVVAVSAETLDGANDGALVYLSGRATSDETLADPGFAVTARALKLRRLVEMFQWQERSETKTVKELGGGERKETVYRYRQVWSDSLIESARFKRPDDHRNPATMPFATKTFVAAEITLGAFQLSEPFVGQIDNFAERPVGEADRLALEPALGDEFRIHQGQFFRGDPMAPQIGDLRVGFATVPPGDVSLVGQQRGGRIESFRGERGSLELLQLGRVGVDDLFSAAEAENAVITWLIRAGGLLLLWIGLFLVLRPLKVVADVLPIAGSLVGAGLGLLTGLAALALGFITISLAWFFYRPVLAIVLLAIAGAAVVGGGVIARRARAKQVAMG